MDFIMVLVVVVVLGNRIIFVGLELIKFVNFLFMWVKNVNSFLLINCIGCFFM